MLDIASDYRLPSLLVLAFTKRVTTPPNEVITCSRNPRDGSQFMAISRQEAFGKYGKPASPRRPEEEATPTGEAELPGVEEKMSQDIGDMPLEPEETGHPTEEMETEEPEPPRLSTNSERSCQTCHSRAQRADLIVILIQRVFF